MLNVTDDEPADDLRRHHRWGNQPPLALRFSEKPGAWQDVRRLGTCVGLHVGVHDA